MRILQRTVLGLVCCTFPLSASQAGELTISVAPDSRVASIGVVRRFDENGTLARPVNPKAKFEAPYYDQVISRGSAHFQNLLPGTYDAIVFLKDGTRLEGYHWPIFNEFDDPDDPAFATPPPDEVVQFLKDKIAGTRYYENKVTPLVFAGDEKHVRVLMQLLRDRKTSYDKKFGAPVATLRYEVWQFTNQYGGWVRDKHSKVLHRLLDSVANMRTKTWLWDRKLGGWKVTPDRAAMTVSYEIPADLTALPGLKPY